MITWAPSYKADGIRVLDVPTAWNGLEFVIPVLVDDFGINRNLALEFGVDYGFSTSAFANVFKYVVGVDTFAGDPHAGWRGDSEEMFRAVQDNMKQFPNVILLKETWERFAEKQPELKPDLIHVDIFHEYEPTYECGKWAVEHSPCVIFHDTVSFPEVMRAVKDLAKAYKRRFYHYQNCHGLGILV